MTDNGENSEGGGESSDGKKQTLRNGNERYVAPAENDYAVGHGAPDNNTNAFTHGVTAAEPMNLLGELEDDERELIDNLTSTYLDIAPFTVESPLYERLQITCIKAVQERRGEREIIREGPTVEKVVSVSEDGKPITEKDEHYLAKFTSRLSKDIRLSLKSLGALPDPESQQAEATESLALVLSGESDE